MHKFNHSECYVITRFSGGQDSKFEQLMVNMLDERDKLLDQLHEAQRRLLSVIIILLFTIVIIIIYDVFFFRHQCPRLGYPSVAIGSKSSLYRS